jgi:hypothetical protein
MACTYCNANLTIPEHLRTQAIPKVLPAEKIPAPPHPISIPEVDASNVLRQAQPIVTRAWNLYAYWTWLRWILPTCLVIFVIGFVICAALGLIPILWISNR